METKRQLIQVDVETSSHRILNDLQMDSINAILKIVNEIASLKIVLERALVTPIDSMRHVGKYKLDVVGENDVIHIRPTSAVDDKSFENNKNDLTKHIRRPFGDTSYGYKEVFVERQGFTTFCNFGKRSQKRKPEKKCVSSKKLFECGTCKKTFSSKRSLLQHIKIHTGEKPYTCSFCSKAFNSSANWRRHKNVHTGVKLFRCGLCQRAFSDRSALVRHMRIHTGKKPNTYK